ncbi:hypothetical protein CDL15_Pgr026799 [Punica granatum]|uniref:Uncharacterized protein n=1 Tax=Punica granatum TaxID=22663 RepID=A0A218WLM1_PUNGR|nr:hypothetical protein CDL15_Pgr026799 [Punica granatum]
MFALREEAKLEIEKAILAQGGQIVLSAMSTKDVAESLFGSLEPRVASSFTILVVFPCVFTFLDE